MVHENPVASQVGIPGPRSDTCSDTKEQWLVNCKEISVLEWKVHVEWWGLEVSPERWALSSSSL